MTLVDPVPVLDAQPTPATSATRLIAVGIRDLPSDDAVLRWAATEAMPGDAVDVVHAFVPSRVNLCRWDSVHRERDRRALAARRVLTLAIRRARTMRVDLTVGGSTVAGLPDDVLVEYSRVVDLLVIGDDSTDPQPVGRRITRRVQDVAGCPVISVPRTGGRFDAPVSVLLDERGIVPEVLRFATEWAERHGVNLRVCRNWSSADRGEISATSLAHQAEAMDVQLADWQMRFPHVGMTGAIETSGEWPSRTAAKSSLLVVAAGSDRSVNPAPIAGSPACTLAVIPV